MAAVITPPVPSPRGKKKILNLKNPRKSATCPTRADTIALVGHGDEKYSMIV